MAKKNFMNLMKEKTTDLKPSMLSAEEDIKSRILVIDQLRHLIPPLSDEELDQLEQNIREHGIKDPLSIWETTSRAAGIDNNDTSIFVLIDGHNRYQLGQKYKLDFRINLMQFASLDEVKDYMISYQLGRRNLTSVQASMLRGMRYNHQKSARGSNLQAESHQANVAELLANQYGVSTRTIKRDGEFATGIEKLAPDLKRDVLAGKKKLPKSAIKALAKTNPAEPIVEVDTILAKTDGIYTDNNEVIADPINQIKVLQQNIRKLANSELTQRSCKQLIKKATELLALQSAK